jgi:hypothetical protein
VTDEIVAAYLDGATFAEIRERFGVGDYQIRSRLRVAGVAPRFKARVPPAVQAEMCRLRDAGHSRLTVARMTGWSAGAVDRAMERRARGRG